MGPADFFKPLNDIAVCAILWGPAALEEAREAFPLGSLWCSWAFLAAAAPTEKYQQITATGGSQES